MSYLVPTLMFLLKTPSSQSKGSPSVIIVCDTKALILQVDKVLRNLLDEIPSLKEKQIEFLFGGKQVEKERFDVLLTTFEQLKNNLIKKKVSLSGVKLVVVDEADNVLRTEFSQNYCINLVNKQLEQVDYKLLMISATRTPEFDSVVSQLKIKGNLIQASLPNEELTLKNVSQYMMMVEKQEEKPRLLQTLIQKLDVQNILVFGNNKERLHELKDFLDKEGYKVAFIYQKDGEQSNQVEFMEQQTRDFIQGRYRILLVTNLYARGIDMRKVTLVVNYNLPLLIKENDRSREVDLPTYLHRVGRTGRFGDKGIAINLVEPRDLELIEKIQECYKNEIKLLENQNLDEVNENL